MTTGIGPYVVPTPIDTDPAATVLETTFTVSQQTVDIGGGLMVNGEVYNGAIPGPTLFLNRDDTVIVRLVNLLPHATGIHWHGIELANSADGTEVTQDGVVPLFTTPPPSPAPAGGTYLYKFKVPRPGIYWYHPHHHHSANRVFKGLYGMIVVADPNEATLITSGVLPSAADTVQLVLSDITVCKAPGSNDAATYVDPTTIPLADRPEWLSGATAQLGPTPEDLCEIPPAGSATTDHGDPAVASYAAGDVPSIVRTGRVTEGQTVLTNGVNVGGRNGTPASPGALAAGASTRPVLSGQGLRLQIVNCAHLRYFRLRLTTEAGVQVPLVRVGGEGGLLDNAVREGGTMAGFNTRYDAGEILLPPGTRADVVAAIPAGLPMGSVLTLWTRDFQRTGATNPGNWAQLPTVPVMHLNVTGNVMGAPYTIDGGADGVGGTPLLASIPAPVETLGAANGAFLVPATFAPPKPGMPVAGLPDTLDIRMTTPPGVNGVVGMFEDFVPYTAAPHINSSRYAEQGRILELTVINMSDAHHPFHLHGFSFQPISLVPRPGAPMGTPTDTFTWPYREFRDNIDLPRNYQLTFRVRLDDRELLDGVTMGGALGRWLFHCHIFFHHHQGMISELVVTAADGSEKPNVDVGGSWAYAPVGGTATRAGTFSHPDGDVVTLTATLADGTPFGAITFPPGVSSGTWQWQLDTTIGPTPASTQYVYITATDPAGRKDQAVFRCKIGAPDDGADNGDPHIHTVDGKRYDFQAVGEFVLLRDTDGMEIQARQTPVKTATPITDPYSGLRACVSVNTAVAARVGSHRISYQPGGERGRLQFFLDGKPARLTNEGIDLEGHRVSAFDADGETGLRVDYAHHAVLLVTPHFWTSHGIWYMNVSVSHTHGEEGVMGRIPEQSWLPALPSGATVGPKPQSLSERYVQLYRTFANAWRVTDKTSLFVYAPGTSTATFTDEDWPAPEPPCKLKPQFDIPGVPTPVNIDIETAKLICQGVTIDGLNQDCVFDVATTGDESFAKSYLLAQALKLHASTVQVVGDKPQTRRGETLTITATVLPVSGGRPTPTGSVTFLVDGVAAGAPVKLDGQGRARLTTDRLGVGEHKIRAAYTSGAGDDGYHPSSSPNLLHTVNEAEGPVGGTAGGTKRMIWLWILIILILIAILAYWYFS
jgi:FtsP/CotA-like multicopper oxidase with cupredoxin domain